MRTLRPYIINIYSIVGIVAFVLTMVSLTGFLFGIISPQAITWLIAKWASAITASPMNWMVIAFIFWVLAIWSISFLIRTRTHPPLLVREDETGAVEVSTDALCSMARAELKAQGVKGASRAEFSRKLGSPMLQVWCDLTSVDEADGPVALGEKLKREIELRFRNDFNLEGIKVAIIHQPGSNGFSRPKARMSG